MVLANLEFQVLKHCFPLRADESKGRNETAGESRGTTKLTRLLGRHLLDSLKGKTVIDFGCGEGFESIALAQAGAQRVIGLDIRDDVLEVARQNAGIAGVSDVCEFTREASTNAEVVISIDAFEHFADPVAILGVMDRLLAPGGEVIVSFGPTWYHPMGGHLFSVFPWAHLIFSEQALVRWRAQYRSDGATKISEVAGGLNRITIRRFEQIVGQSAFRFATFEAVPIAKLRPIHTPFTREFTTAIVRCRLVRKADAQNLRSQ